MPRRLLRITRLLATALAALCAVVVVVYTVLYFTWNDEAIAHTVSGWVSGNLRGEGGPTGQAFVIGRAHYPYWCSLRSLFVGGACQVDCKDVRIYDPHGDEIIGAPRVLTDFYVGEVVWAQAWSLLGGPDIQLHFDRTEVFSPHGDVHADQDGEVTLVAAFRPRRPSPHPSKGGMVIRVDSGRLHDADFRIAFPGWSGHVAHADADRVALRFSSFSDDNPNPERPDFTYEVSPIRAPSADLRLGAFSFPLEAIAISRFGATADARQRLVFEATTASLGAALAVSGSLEDIYSKHPGSNVAIRFQHGAGLVRKLPTGELLGGDPAGTVGIHGPFSHTIIEGEVAGGEVHLAGLTARDASTLLYLDGGRLALPGARAHLAGGRIDADVVVDFAHSTYEAELHALGVDPAGLAPLLPAAARRALGGRLEGGALARGSFDPAGHPERIRVSGISAHLDRRARDRLPRRLEAAGNLRYSPERVQLDGVSLSGDGVRAEARGSLSPTSATADADVIVDADHLGPLLRRLGLPAVVEAAHASAHLSGPLADPTASGHATALGVGLGTVALPRIDADLRLERGRLAATRIHGEGPVGGVEGEVAIGLWHVAAPTLDLHLAARHLRLHVLTQRPEIHGELSGTLDLHGPLADLRGGAQLSLPELDLAGDAYRDGELALSLHERGKLQIDTLSLKRSAGGQIFGQGTIDMAGPPAAWGLDVKLAPRDFPLAAIRQLRTLPFPVGGILSGEVHLGGEVSHPLFGGVVKAVAVKLREVLLGDGRLQLDPQPDRIHLVGQFWHCTIDGEIRIVPSLAVHVTIAFADLPLDELIPEMRKLAEVRASVWGQGQASWDLARGLQAELRLKKIVLFVGGEEGSVTDEGAHPHRSEFRNEGDVVIATDGNRLTFKQAHLRSLRDEAFKITGDVSATDSNVHLIGRIELPLLEYFASSWFCHTHGDADAELTITGPASRPHVIGRLDLKGAELEPRVGGCIHPPGEEREAARRMISVPSGTLAFEPDGLRLVRLNTRIDGAVSVANGHLGLRDWVPGEIALSIKGELTSKVLEWAFPEQIAEAEGRLGIDASVAGDFHRPTWHGSLRLRGVRFRLRKPGRDVTITAGTVRLEDYDVTLGCPLQGAPPDCHTITARVDDSSDVGVDGLLRFAGLWLEHVDVHVVGENLETGSPGIYSLTFSPDVVLSGSGERLALSGAVRLVSGAFVQEFAETQLIIHPRAVESEPPVYEGISALEQLALRLNISSSGPLSIKNNLAAMQVTVPLLTLGGTLSRPTLSGTVLVEEGGTFRIPYLHAEFITERGQIDFDPALSFPDKTPHLDVHANYDHVDRYDQIHHILLTLVGTYQSPVIELRSTDGWDRAQVLALLATGSLPDDVRRSFSKDPTATTSGGGNGLLGTFSGDTLGAVVSDPLQSILRLDTVRIELGYVRLCLYNTRYIKACGLAEGQITPTSHYEGSLNLQLSDTFSAAATAEHVERGIETTEDVVNRGRLQLKLKIPIF